MLMRWTTAAERGVSFESCEPLAECFDAADGLGAGYKRTITLRTAKVAAHIDRDHESSGTTHMCVATNHVDERLLAWTAKIGCSSGR